MKGVSMPDFTSRTKPGASPDNPSTQVFARRGKYFDTYTHPLLMTKHGLADEGSYFSAQNPTPGTGIQLNANVTAFSDTNALFVVQNTNLASNALGASIYMDYLRLLLLATAPTATVSMQFAFRKSTVSREPTTAANRTVLTASNMRASTGIASIGKYMSYTNAGAMTVPASVAGDVQLGRCSLVTGLGIAGDEYVVKFGGEDMAPKIGLTAVRATDVARIVTHAPPIVIDPGEWLVVHMWWLTAATTAATFEFDMG